MRIIITGGTGFIGKNLLKKISSKTNKICLVSRNKQQNKNNITYIKSNLKLSKKNFDLLKKFQPNLLIHLAWEGIPDYSEKNSKKNYDDQVIFFNQIKKLKTIKHIIATGSCAEYNLVNGKLDEKQKGKNYSYLSKYKSKLYEHIKKNISKELTFTWLRLFYVFGFLQRQDALIPFMIKKIKKNQTIKLKRPYDERDFINVCDVCNSIVLFMNNKKAGIYNVGSGVAYSPLNIAKIISGLLKLKLKIEYSNKLSKNSFCADIKKISKIGWKQKYTLKKYLKEKMI